MHIAQLEDACIDISILRDKYKSEFTEAYAVADAQMAKAIATEETLFHLENHNKERLRKERHPHTAKLSKVESKFNKELFGVDSKLAKERRGHELVMSHRELQWPKALELKLSQAKQIHGVEKKDMHSQMKKKE